uniref:hypothetical protein n=1 Tax=Streptomyces sp. WZ-12 TaxID=3030210 RepID=UPI00315818C2
MTGVIISGEAVEEVKPAGAPDALDDQLISQLVDRAKADGIRLTGQGGLLQLTKKILASALKGEFADHLGHEKHEKAVGGNLRGLAFSGQSSGGLFHAAIRSFYSMYRVMSCRAASRVKYVTRDTR